LQETSQHLSADEVALKTKIEKKQSEFDRAERRLKSLQAVRPAYMDEYEKVELELTKVYQIYMEKFRNLAFLEQQIDQVNRDEQDQVEASLFFLFFFEKKTFFLSNNQNRNMKCL
jgi:clusterin-associated protein 1